METRNEELLSLRDKANLALGFAYLQAQRPADARPILERVRLEGPFSSMALLGVGWADSALGEFKQALVPWLALRKRNLLDAAVQESYLTVPYAYNQLGAPGQAAEYYSAAIDSFDAEFKRIDESIEQIRGGNLLDRLLKDDKKDTLTWYWQLKTLPDAPESRYLYQLLASNEFQEGLKNYRELKFMSRNLDDWREDVAAFDNMLDTRQHAYNEEVPKADAVMAATDLDALTRKRVDFESRINAIEKSNDVAALGTPEEQRTWARIKRIEDFVQMHPDDPDLAEMRDKLRLMKGVMYWRLSESFKARLWNERRSVKELEASLIETQKRAVQVQQARAGVPTNTGAFADRVAATRARMDELQARLAALTDKQAHYLQDLAIEELGRQRQRIETYQVQARFELAAIYDKTANKPAGKPPAAPPATRHAAGGQAEEQEEVVVAVVMRRAALRIALAGVLLYSAVAGASSSKEPDHQGPGEAAAGRREPRAAARRRRQQDHAELQALPRLERRRRGAARGGDAPAGRSESGELGIGAHRARARDQRGTACDRGDPPLHGAAQGLSQVRAQRLGALSAGARLRAQRTARQGACDARPAGGVLSRTASTSTRRSSAAARSCSRTNPIPRRRPPTRR